MLSANSFTPVARITFPSAILSGTPSSTAAVRNSRANTGSRRSSARPSFQSLLRLAMLQLLRVRRPALLGLLDVLGLGAFVATEQQQHQLAAAPSEVDAVSGTEGQAGLQNSVAKLLVVAQVAVFEAQDASLDACSRREVEPIEPLSKRASSSVIQVLADDQRHCPLISHKIISSTGSTDGARTAQAAT